MAARSKPSLGSIDAAEVVARAVRSQPRRTLTRALAVAAAVVVVAGLGLGLWFGGVFGPRVIDAGPAGGLTGPTWTLLEIDGDPVLADPPYPTPSLVFGARKVSGTDGCNPFSGTYRRNGDQLTLSDLASTEVGCRSPESVSRQRAAYNAALSQVTRVQLAGPTLTLTGAPGTPVLFFTSEGANPSPPATPRPPTTVQIRIRNASPSAVLTDIRVVFGRGSADYGTLAPGGVSDYHTAAKAYQYAYVRALVDGREQVLQPIDYVGETPLSPGRYTYVLTSDSGSLDLSFETDP